jgi:hypothetical protein
LPFTWYFQATQHALNTRFQTALGAGSHSYAQFKDIFNKAEFKFMKHLVFAYKALKGAYKLTPEQAAACLRAHPCEGPRDVGGGHGAKLAPNWRTLSDDTSPTAWAARAWPSMGV